MTITAILYGIFDCSQVPSLCFLIAALLTLIVGTVKMQIHLNDQIFAVNHE